MEGLSERKPWLKSRTVRWGLLQVAIAVFSFIGSSAGLLSELLDAKTAALILLGSGMITVALRAVTTGPIQLPGFEGEPPWRE